MKANSWNYRILEFENGDKEGFFWFVIQQNTKIEERKNLAVWVKNLNLGTEFPKEDKKEHLLSPAFVFLVLERDEKH